jgi:hypothetical protein
MKKIILLVFLLVVAVGGWYAYKLYTEKNPDQKNKTPDFTTDATSLIAAFNKDSASASKLYINKLVLVSGTVTKTDTSGVISLGNSGEMSAVQCMMDERHKEDYASVKEGQTVSIKGKCTGFKSETMLDVNLGTTVEMNFCIIINNK